jgi:alkanesulfonate monooxygenase SsuD/methylene tetrahydromethanopterin reductase-like flavin-dependent oxidoreductase (luciferase family)/molybdopterin converting factor small subunit
MRVRVFASLRELAGGSVVDVDGTTVAEILKAMSERFGPAFDRVMEAGSVVVNGDRVAPGDGTDRPLGPDDDVALLPPVSGGGRAVPEDRAIEAGIGIPNALPWVTGSGLVEWARRADAAGMSTAATIGRVAYPSHDDLTVLAAAAAATGRIRLMTDVLLAPTHNPVLLAKQAASIHALSGGRLRLGIGVGRRPDDYEAAGQDYSDRGRRLDRALEVMTAIWSGETDVVPNGVRPLVPAEVPAKNGPVELVIGGTSPKSIERVLRFGTGWTAGGAPPDRVGAFAEAVLRAWSAAGKPGRPRIFALRYFALGDEAVDQGRRYLLDYYAGVGEDAARSIADGLLSTPGRIREALAAYAAVGVDELIFCGTVADPSEVERLSEALNS